MRFEGVVERMSRYSAAGWVRLFIDNNEESIDSLIIKIHRKGKLLGEGVASGDRPDLKLPNAVAFGFRINLKNDEETSFGSDEISVIAVVKDQIFPLKLMKSVEVALALNGLSPSMVKQTIECLDASIIERIGDLVNFEAKLYSQVRPKNPLCVLTYANDAGAWFPYFYNYYSKIAGESSIYVVTPKPENFSTYALGGVITIPDLEYDDAARSVMMSHFSSGLLAQYRWSLVCDVDEIVIPNPKLNVKLREYLDNRSEDVILSLGIDVVQLDGEVDFDFSRSIFDQRKCGVLNSAMCKPHASRVPIRYSGGYHYCNKKLDFPEPGGELITLHLKWACSRVRAEVAKIVAGVNYKDSTIEEYSLTSVLSDAHPLVENGNRVRTLGLSEKYTEDFKEKYRNNLKFDSERGLWVGPHRSEGFLVKLT